MKRKHQFFRVSVACAIAFLLSAEPGTMVAAQEDAVHPAPLPAGPLLRPVPDFSTWQIAFSYSDDPAKNNLSQNGSPLPNSDAPRSVAVTRTKSLWCAAQRDKVGKIWQTWFDGYISYLSTPQYPRPAAIASDSIGFIPKFLDYGDKKPAFPDFDWVSPKTFIGTQTIREIPCIVFRKADGEQTAWIDSAGRLPVRWVGKGELRDFLFGETPSTELTLPPEVTAISKAMAAVRENNNRKPPRGG